MHRFVASLVHVQDPFMERSHLTSGALRWRTSLGWLVPISILGAVALTVVKGDHGEDLAHASTTLIPDADRDGLRDEFEVVLQTDVDDSDTDGDGWSDAEEFALRTNPHDEGRFPEGTERVSVAMAARQTGGTIHVLSAIYFRDGANLPNSMFSMGSRVVASGRPSIFSCSLYAQNETVVSSCF